MKKLLAFICCFGILFIFTACGDKTTESDVKLTADEALNIALTEANVSKADISNLKSKLEKDDGIYVYDIDFNAQGTEHSYDIDANTGKIVEKSHDIMD